MCRAAKQLGAQQFRYRHDTGLPEEVDWRKAGIVGPIKNQHKGGAPVRASYFIVFHLVLHCANSALLPASRFSMHTIAAPVHQPRTPARTPPLDR